MFKRVPKSKSGKILVAVRNRLMFDPLVTAEKIERIVNLNKRIQRRFVSEDKRNNIQSMMTDYRTVIEYSDGGRLYRSVFTGTITEAQKTLNIQRRRESIKGPYPVVHWAHFTKGNEMLMGGMWLTTNVEKVLTK